MDNIKLLRKLIDEDAITFLKSNEKNYDNQFNSFINMNRQEHVYGVDLSEGEDMTAYTPL